MNMKAKEQPGRKSAPQTVAEAVDQLVSELSLKDRTKIANMQEDDLISLQFSLGRYIREKFDLWAGNTNLMESCRFAAGEVDLHADNASSVILTELWKKLRETNLLRVVK